MLGERIKIARCKRGLSQAEIGKKMGNISRAAVSKWENGTNKPKELDLLAHILRVDINWLRYNKGAMESNGVSKYKLNNNNSKTSDISTSLNDSEVEVVLYKSIELAINNEAQTINPNYKKEQLRFSRSLLIKQNIDENNIFCFLVNDNGMKPVIPKGAIVAVNKGKQQINDGSVYAICQSDFCRLRRLYRLSNNRIRIVSYNLLEYPDEIEDSEKIKIIGKVFHCAFELD